VSVACQHCVGASLPLGAPLCTACKRARTPVLRWNAAEGGLLRGPMQVGCPIASLCAGLASASCCMEQAASTACCSELLSSTWWAAGAVKLDLRGPALGALVELVVAAEARLAPLPPAAAQLPTTHTYLPGVADRSPVQLRMP
jgi:hypothetical protein